MAGGLVALRLDDVGAASKQHEVYGTTRVAVGRWRVPFPGNFLFLKYLPPVKRWGPYRELGAAEWERVLGGLEARGSRMTVAVTAGWVEADGRVVPFPRKFPAAAATIRQGVERGFLEVANHGYTHCVLQDRLYLPRAFKGNREFHREFYDWIPEKTHREHVVRAQAILEEFFARRVVTFIPPGNVLSRRTVAALAEVGIRYLSCRDAARWGPVQGMTFVDDSRVVTMHDRDLVLGGVETLEGLLRNRQGTQLVTIREIGERG